MSNHSHPYTGDFFIPVSKNDPPSKKVSVTDLIKLREVVFDRWCWETGDEEDRALFEEIDNIIESIKQRCSVTRMFYCPYVPLMK